MGSWDRPKSYIPVRELGRLQSCDSIEGIPEESLLEISERGFGLGAGGTIDDLESAEPLVLGWYFVDNSSPCCVGALESVGGNLIFASSGDGL